MVSADISLFFVLYAKTLNPPLVFKPSVFNSLALVALLTMVVKLISVFCPSFSNSSFCEQLVIAKAAVTANKIFFITVSF